MNLKTANMNILTNRRRAAQSGSPVINYLITEESNKPVYDICLAQGWCGAEGMTYEEAAAVTNISTYFQKKNSITHFEELQYFGITSIANYAFWKNGNMEVIKLPDSVTTINAKAFAQCDSLLYIDIPASVTSISAGAFTYQSSNNGSMQYIKVYPTTPPSIADSQGDTILKGTNDCPVYVPDASVSAYKTAWSDVADRIKPLSAFSDILMTAKSNPEVFPLCVEQGWCSADGMTYEDAAAVTDIVRVFQQSNIVHFEEFEFFNVTELKYSAFQNCRNLETITLPTNLLKFNGTAIFQGCQNLKNIDIPSTVTDIGTNCFAGCSSMQYAIVRATTPPTLGNATAFGTTGTTYPIYVPDASVNDYKSANNWNNELIVNRIRPISEFVEPQSS